MVGLIPRVLPSNARTFPAPAGAAVVHVPAPPLFPSPGTGCGPKIEIFLGSFFLGFLLDNASNMCPNSLYVVLETSPRLSAHVPECDPSHRDARARPGSYSSGRLS